MLHFWVPRTVQFEEALTGSLQWPFLFQEFDTRTEKLTIRILVALSRFENVQDLPQETITNILVNEALRLKLTGELNVEKEIELVKEALIEENKKVREKLEAAESKVNETDLIISGLRHQIEKSGQQLSEERQSRRALEERIIELENRIQSTKAQEEVTHRRRIFVIRWFILPAILITFLGLWSSLQILSLTRVKIGTAPIFRGHFINDH
jgi:hypothetical protein